MPVSVVMPALEMAQETGKLVAWRKKEGERVAKGEPLLEIETDKAVLEIEAPADGVLADVTAVEGAEVPVGQTIAWIVAPGEAAPAEAAATDSPRPEAATVARRATPTAVPSPVRVTTDVRISPKARRVAREHGIDFTQLQGTGPEGVIVTEDVLAAVRPKPAPANPPLSAVARLMAERTAQSWTSVPHFFLVRDADAGALAQFREQIGAAVEQKFAVRPTYTDVLVALVARVLAKHPLLNASWIENGIRTNSDINIAVAIAVNDGVVAPVIHAADKAQVGEIAVRTRELAERARAGRLHPADLAGGTFTITNLGMYDVDAFTAVISPPQAAILAVGRIAERVIAVEGRPAVRSLMTLTLSTDHRVADGARAAAFMSDVVVAIANPQQWAG